MIFELNTDNQAKELLEEQRCYREQMATEYADGYEAAEEKHNLYKILLDNAKQLL